MAEHISEEKSNADLISGWRLSATLQLRTPLKYLEMHGMRICVANGPPPDIPQRHGTWVVVLKTFAELGIDIPEFEVERFSASELGPVPLDGGEFLAFAKDVRRAVEAAATSADGVLALHKVLAKQDWADFVERLGGVERISRRFYKPTSRKDKTPIAIFETE